MAGKSIYFTRKELEGLRDFIKYLETDGKPDDEELYDSTLAALGGASKNLSNVDAKDFEKKAMVGMPFIPDELEKGATEFYE